MNFSNLIELRGGTSRSENSFLGILGVLLLITSWQIAALMVNKTMILPSPIINIFAGSYNPTSVITCIPELWFSDLLLKNTLYSLYLNGMGYLIAIAVGVPLGFLFGLSPIAKNLFNKPIDALRFVPLTAMTGIFIQWFGIYSWMKIVFLAFGIFVYLVPVVAQRVVEVEEVYDQTLRTLGASKWQRITKVFIPGVMAKVSDDIRVLTAISWTYITVAELLNNQGGLGSLTVRAARQGRLDKAFFTLALIILLGMTQDRLFKFLDKKVFKFKYSNGGK